MKGYEFFPYFFLQLLHKHTDLVQTQPTLGETVAVEEMRSGYNGQLQTNCECVGESE